MISLIRDEHILLTVSISSVLLGVKLIVYIQHYMGMIINVLGAHYKQLEKVKLYMHIHNYKFGAMIKNCETLLCW